MNPLPPQKPCYQQRYVGRKETDYRACEMFVWTLPNIPEPYLYNTVRKYGTSVSLDLTDNAEVQSFIEYFVDGGNVHESTEYNFHGEASPVESLRKLLSTEDSTIPILQKVGHTLFGVGVSVVPKDVKNPGSNVEIKFGAGIKIGIENVHSFAHENLFVINIHIDDAKGRKAADAFGEFVAKLPGINGVLQQVIAEFVLLTPESKLVDKMRWATTGEHGPKQTAALDYWVDTCTKLTDKDIACAHCKSNFVFSRYDQVRYAQLGFEEPKRCNTCRGKK